MRWLSCGRSLPRWKILIPRHSTKYDSPLYIVFIALKNLKELHVVNFTILMESLTEKYNDLLEEGAGIQRDCEAMYVMPFYSQK